MLIHGLVLRLVVGREMRETMPYIQASSKEGPKVRTVVLNAATPANVEFPENRLTNRHNREVTVAIRLFTRSQGCSTCQIIDPPKS